MRGTIAVDPSQKTADELRQLSSLQYTKDPGMIDTRVCGSKICQKKTRLSRGIRNMGEGSSLDLENVICHLSGRDTPLRGVYASHGVPVKASTNCSGEYLSIEIAKRQRT